MAKKDYYAILGIDKKSSPEEIKKAYREKAKEHHPDRNIGDALSVSKFQEIQEEIGRRNNPSSSMLRTDVTILCMLTESGYSS